MSTFQIAVDVCTCCYRPVENCNIAQQWLSRGVPMEWITEERLFPELSKDANRVAI